jgi:hypothetical protein
MTFFKGPKIINPNGKYNIAALDFGIKCNQMRLLSKLGARITLLPWDADFDINGESGAIRGMTALLPLHLDLILIKITMACS